MTQLPSRPQTARQSTQTPPLLPQARIVSPFWQEPGGLIGSVALAQHPFGQVLAQVWLVQMNPVGPKLGSVTHSWPAAQGGRQLPFTPKPQAFGPAAFWQVTVPLTSWMQFWLPSPVKHCGGGTAQTPPLPVCWLTQISPAPMLQAVQLAPPWPHWKSLVPGTQTGTPPPH